MTQKLSPNSFRAELRKRLGTVESEFQKKSLQKNKRKSSIPYDIQRKYTPVVQQLKSKKYSLRKTKKSRSPRKSPKKSLKRKRSGSVSKSGSGRPRKVRRRVPTPWILTPPSPSSSGSSVKSWLSVSGSPKKSLKRKRSHRSKSSSGRPRKIRRRVPTPWILTPPSPSSSGSSVKSWLSVSE